MIRDSLQHIVESAVQSLVSRGAVPPEVQDVPVEISDTKQPEHGDFACNFALSASKRAGLNPRQLGELLRDAVLESSSGIIKAVEVAGPGFLNFRLDPAWVASFVPKVLELGADLPRTQNAAPATINVEFVSVNPNGPITIGSGRGAAYGSTLCNVLAAAGNRVHREYYINDGVNSEQMTKFAESVRCIAAGQPIPEGGYRGDYVQDVAKGLISTHGEKVVLEKAAAKDLEWFQRQSESMMLLAQRSALESFGTQFDTWFSEQSLHDAGAVQEEIDKLIASNVADNREVRTVLKLARGGVIEDVMIEDQTGKAPVDEGHGDEPEDTSPSDNSADVQPTLWLRSTKFGDDMDRVLRRRDGRLTYIASDVSYHKDKLTDASGIRGTGQIEKMITILGPDHHGYIGRLQAVVAAMLVAEGKVGSTTSSSGEFTEIEAKIYTSPEERDTCLAALAEARRRLEVQIFQLVRFMKDGKPAPMRKRDGNIYALIDLMREIGDKVKPEATEAEKLEAGKDVSRFFYLMRSHDTTFDFDLDLAEKQSDENPVFYVQYAHARICSVIAKAAEQGLSSEGFEVRDGDQSGSFLTHERELTLIRKVCDLPFEVARCAEDYGVHRLTTYAIELARTYHHFYDVCRVIQPEQPELSRARLALCAATRVALKATLDLLGISAPERM